MRAALLCLPLGLFLVYAWKDNLFHFRGRKVSRGEHLLHLVLGVVLVGLVSACFRLDLPRLTVFGGLFALAGAADEYGYHRDIPAEEHALHAKEHLALLLFVLGAWVSA